MNTIEKYKKFHKENTLVSIVKCEDVKHLNIDSIIDKYTLINDNSNTEYYLLDSLDIDSSSVGFSIVNDIRLK